MDIQAILDSVSEELEARGAIELAASVDQVVIAAPPAKPEPKAKEEPVKPSKPEKKEAPEPKPEPEPKEEKKKKPVSKGMVHWSGNTACAKSPGEKTLDPTMVTCKKCKEALRQAGIATSAVEVEAKTPTLSEAWIKDSDSLRSLGKHRFKIEEEGGEGFAPQRIVGVYSGFVYFQTTEEDKATKIKAQLDELAKQQEKIFTKLEQLTL